MPRKPRFIIPGHLHEVTLSTFQGRYFFIPSERLNELVIGAIAYARDTYDIDFCCGSFLSNHGHWLVVPDTAEQFSAFLCLAKSQIAQEVQRLCGWKGGIFKDSDVTVIADDLESQVERLKYVLAQGVKEGLVPHPAQWPGMQCAKALTTGAMRLQGVWVDRTGLYEPVRKKTRQSKAARRRELDRATYKSYEKKIMLQLSPIPRWRHLETKEIAKRCRELIRQILEDYADVIASVRPGYRRRLTDKRMFCYRPDQQKSGIRPLVHAQDGEVWKCYAERANQFFRQFKRASERLRQGILEAVHEFPEHAFLPTGIVSRFAQSLPPPPPSR